MTRPSDDRALPEAGQIAVDAALATDPAHLARRPAPAWQKWLGAGLSLLMIGFLIHQSAKIGWTQFAAVLPRDPRYYLLMVAMYLTLPLTETLIFRRLWALPWSSLWLFLRKRVLNEAVFGYSGEAYVYLWARRQTGLAARAMAAVKDVSITSALAANCFTVAVVAVLVLFGDRLLAAGFFSPTQLRSVIWGAALLTLPAFIILLFSKRIMSLPRAVNLRIFAVHVARLLLSNALLIAAWHFALPDIAWSVWLMLIALRLVISRVPFAPNTDLLFSSVGVGLAGSANVEIAALLAFGAALVLVGHGLVIVADWVAGLSPHHKGMMA